MKRIAEFLSTVDDKSLIMKVKVMMMIYDKTLVLTQVSKKKKKNAVGAFRVKGKSG